MGVNKRGSWRGEADSRSVVVVITELSRVVWVAGGRHVLDLGLKEGLRSVGYAFSVDSAIGLLVGVKYALEEAVGYNEYQAISTRCGIINSKRYTHDDDIAFGRPWNFSRI